MSEKYYPPVYFQKSFNCPKCGVYAVQKWLSVWEPSAQTMNNFSGFAEVDYLKFAICQHCNYRSLWLSQKMIDPASAGVQLPNSDLTNEVIEDYNEAATILNMSPRGSAALLRLAIQKLCKILGESGKDINSDIKKMVEKGLPLKIQQSLDYVRVIGNEAVHPGQIDLKDNREIALNLFSLINLIAEVMITQPKHVDTLYNSLPADKLKAISNRDKK